MGDKIPTRQKFIQMTRDPTLETASTAKRVLLLGATGTIGRATAKALSARGHDVVCIVRHRRPNASASAETLSESLAPSSVRSADVTDATSLERDAFRGEHFDALVSCLASRTGSPKDAWAIDHDAHVTALDVAKRLGVPQFVMLSAICVQKPRLAFQEAKLAFEAKLMASRLTYSIVRPTAFFKSLSGQVARVKSGKPFLVFGDGRLTTCKPISDRDLATFLARCVDDTRLHNRCMPIGGPGPAITPLDQAHALFRLTGRAPKIKHVPVGLLDVIIKGLSIGGFVIPKLAEKAELAKIGRYYATESMLVYDPATGRYDADATPEAGNDTLFQFYEKLLSGEASAERGDHAVF